MSGNLPRTLVEPTRVNPIVDAFFFITAPWKQQYRYINELLSKQHETYKAADANSENLHLLAIEILEMISFAIPHYQKDIAHERDIFSKTDENDLQLKYNELIEVQKVFENWVSDTYPKIVERFTVSAARLKTDIEEQLRIRLDSRKQGDILDSLMSALEVNRHKSPSSLKALAKTLQRDCQEKCEVVSREILDPYFEEFTSITGDTFEEIRTSLGVEFSEISHDKGKNGLHNSFASPFVDVGDYGDNYYGSNFWTDTFNSLKLPALGLGSAVIVATKLISGGGWMAWVAIGTVGLTGAGLIITGVGAATVAILRGLKSKDPCSEIQAGLVSYVEQVRDETIQNFSEFHKGVVSNTESLLKSIVEGMRTKQTSSFRAISEVPNISEEEKDQKVAVLDATSNQLQKLSVKIKECLGKGN